MWSVTYFIVYANEVTCLPLSVCLSVCLTVCPVYFSGFTLWGCHGQVGGTRFQVGMTGADQRRYLRPDE